MFVCLFVFLSTIDSRTTWLIRMKILTLTFYDTEIVLGKMKNLKKIQNAIIIGGFLNNLLTFLANTFCNVKSVCNAIE